MNRRSFLGLSLAVTGGIFVPKFGKWYKQGSLYLSKYDIVNITLQPGEFFLGTVGVDMPSNTKMIIDDISVGHIVSGQKEQNNLWAGKVVGHFNDSLNSQRIRFLVPKNYDKPAIPFTLTQT